MLFAPYRSSAPSLYFLYLYISFSLSSSFSLSQRYLSTPWHRTPNVGDADVKRHRYLIVTHSAPLYPHHHDCKLFSLRNALSPHQASPYTSVFRSSILAFFPSKMKNRGTFETEDEKNKNWGSENANTHLTSSLKAAQSRWQGRQNEVEIHIARRVFKFQESVQFQYPEFRRKTAMNQRWGVDIWKQCWRNIRGTSSQHPHPCLEGL